MQRRAVKSAMRTFEVLELFRDQRRPLHLIDIYTALGYPQSSTTNLLKSLVLMGYLNYNRRTRTYLPTMLINSLGNWLPKYIEAEYGYREFMEELQRRTDETVGMSTPNDLYIQYMILLTPTHEFKMAPMEGAMRTMVDSSTGLVLMSRMSDRAIDKICRYTNYYELTGGKHLTTASVMKEIEWIRWTGYAHLPNRPTPEVSSIAMPLDVELHGIPLAIGVGGLADRIDRNKMEIVATMRELIADFSSGRRFGSPALAVAAE